VKIKQERPPNFDMIVAVFPHAADNGILFAYDDAIYFPNPSNGAACIPPALLAHESIHLMIQRIHGPDEWWAKYLSDPAFRYSQELMAHAAEYAVQAPGLDRNRKFQLLSATAARLIAPLYNYEPPRQLRQATLDIRRYLEEGAY
jgi:hypothetical protein